MTETSAFFGARRGIGTLGHPSTSRAGASGLSETPSRHTMRLKSGAIRGMPVESKAYLSGTLA
jgi:hypothetical protein